MKNSAESHTADLIILFTSIFTYFNVLIVPIGRRQFMGVVSAAAGGLLLDGLSPTLLAASNRVVTVAKGDTLWGIAVSNKISVQELMRSNGLKNNRLNIGQKLNIPVFQGATGATVTAYTVRKGDSLYSVAKKHKVSIAELRSANRVQGEMIRPGDVLKIPGTGSDTNKKKISPARETSIYVAKAQRKIDVSNLSERRWKHIILHHSGTPTGSGKIFDYYHRNVRRMENGLAYHFVIGNGSESGDGQIEVSERWRRQIQGGHVRSDAYNQNSIGICLVGDFQKSRPTKRQMKAAIGLVDHVKNGLLAKRPDLLLHRDIQETICPGKYFPEKDIHRLFG
jgi:LysM repeat protein